MELFSKPAEPGLPSLVYHELSCVDHKNPTEYQIPGPGMVWLQAVPLLWVSLPWAQCFHLQELSLGTRPGFRDENPGAQTGLYAAPSQGVFPGCFPEMSCRTPAPFPPSPGFGRS